MTSTQQPSSELPKFYVVAAGISAYRAAGLQQLTLARGDANAVGAALQKSGGRLYKSVEVTTLLDEQVTAARLEEVFAQLSQKVTPDDVFVLIMSGQGITVDGPVLRLRQGGDCRQSDPPAAVAGLARPDTGARGRAFSGRLMLAAHPRSCSGSYK
ncbi:hypothetical protein [Bradyrhizobium macuxiense]|uniref:hypothetical protein n=1 Tax=Bradyrhizobium macuxiense TaxID=1755647 RepID=UPI000A8CC42E|nr:hypothetical protein [Bradyrhizobium macuxiense]